MVMSSQWFWSARLAKQKRRVAVEGAIAVTDTLSTPRSLVPESSRSTKPGNPRYASAFGLSLPVPMTSAWNWSCVSVKKRADESVRCRVFANGVNCTVNSMGCVAPKALCELPSKSV